jgi:hypothetical protein
MTKSVHLQETEINVFYSYSFSHETKRAYPKTGPTNDITASFVPSSKKDHETRFFNNKHFMQYYTREPRTL